MDRIKQAVLNYCQQENDILAVYLFGSRAKGCNAENSDVDLAVLLKDDTGTFDLLAFIAALENVLALPVDAVVLNRAGEVLKYQVRARNIILFDRDENLRKSFEVKSRKFFEDFLYIHKRYTQKVLFGE